MTETTNPSQDDLWLDQQLAEAHALLGDIPAQPNAPVSPESENHTQETQTPPRKAARQPAFAGKEEKAPKKDRAIPVLVGVIVVELIAIAAVALYWVSVLT